MLSKQINNFRGYILFDDNNVWVQRN